jgi:hypothetical protein
MLDFHCAADANQRLAQKYTMRRSERETAAPEGGRSLGENPADRLGTDAPGGKAGVYI